MLILNAADVRRSLPMPRAIDAMREAFVALSAGRCVVPHRAHLLIRPHAGVSLVMAAYVGADAAASERVSSAATASSSDGESTGPPEGGTTQEALAVKVVSLFDGNRARGIARIQAAVTVFEPDTGRPIALLDGAALTALRTAAASGAATDALARKDVRVLAVFGAGVQARAHVDAMLAVRPFEKVMIIGRDPGKQAEWIDELRRDSRIHAEIVGVDSPAAALREADVVCATTTAREPIFDDREVKPGTHINAVGSYTPEVREIPGETVVRAGVVVDQRAAAWEEAGDLIQPLRAGLITQDHIRGELGEVLAGVRPGRLDDREVTFFKSVGIAVQDAVAARYALETARMLGLGQEVQW